MPSEEDPSISARFAAGKMMAFKMTTPPIQEERMSYVCRIIKINGNTNTAVITIKLHNRQ
jgi:hypothetical protein